MSKKKSKQENQPDEFTEAEKKALEKLDFSHYIREKQVLNDRIEELQAKVYKQNEEIRKINDDNLIMNSQKQAEIEEANNNFRELTKQFEQYRKQRDDDINKMTQGYELKLKQFHDEKEKKINQLEYDVFTRDNELKSLNEFKIREEQYIKTIHDLREELKMKEYAHHDEIYKTNKNFQKQTLNLTNVNNAKIEEIQRNADKLAEQKVLDQQESIKRENKKIKMEMEIYLKELEQLKKERVILLQENSTLKQGSSITKETENEYRTLNHQQVLKIKKLKEKVEYLKQYISNEVTKYTKEIECMKHQNNQKQQEQDRDIRNLKELLHQKTKEMKSVKALAQMILDQRSDIEQFFLQAIDQVKNEIRKRNIQNKNKLPDISNKSQSIENHRVDINDLDLEEKEKLLRILFSKMNQGVPPTNWKSQLQHQELSRWVLVQRQSFLMNNFIFSSQQYVILIFGFYLSFLCFLFFSIIILKKKKMRVIALAIMLLAVSAASTKTQDQILALLQVGTKANDAIDTVFGLLNDLIQSNKDAQYAADEKNKTDEYIADQTIQAFTKVKQLNTKLFTQSQENRVAFEESLKDTKNYLAWNEQRQEEIERKIEALEDNQCFSNQLFVRSIKYALEALEVIKLLKSDVAGYVINGDSFEFSQTKVQSIGEKLKQYSSLFQDHQIKSFMALANTQENQEPGREATLAERVLHLLETLAAEVEGSLENLKMNEINASWELAGWVSLSEAEVDTLKVEYERKQVFADRTATQISAALAQQAKSKIILQESEDALAQAQADVEAKRESYAEEKAKRDEENAILAEVITIFKKQVASWSGR
ncbi:hypothetical protein pb186bvf_013291 [Paramecium bursaria]